MPKVMKLLDPNTGRMECKVCGAEHYANIKPDSGGCYYRGSWQCVNGCEVPPAARGGKIADVCTSNPE